MKVKQTFFGLTVMGFKAGYELGVFPQKALDPRSFNQQGLLTLFAYSFEHLFLLYPCHELIGIHYSLRKQ